MKRQLGSFQRSARQLFISLILIPQTIEEYFEREVKPHLPKAWIDENKTKTGDEINFTKYFYAFKPLRLLAEIKADILALEASSLELEKTVLED